MSLFSLPCIKNKLCTGSHVRLLKIHDLCLIVILINLFIPQGVCYASGTGKAMQKRKFRRIFILWRITNKKDLNCLDWNDKKGTKIVKPHLFFPIKSYMLNSVGTSILQVQTYTSALSLYQPQGLRKTGPSVPHMALQS